MTQTQNELIGYWAFASETESYWQIYIRFTENSLLQWGYQNEWLICNISHNYWLENGNIGTICPPNPRRELTPYTIAADGTLKLTYSNRETIWTRAEKQEFFESKNIWNPGIPFLRQIDYMALLNSPPHHFQIKRAKNMNISPQILVNTRALWSALEYSNGEFASLHLNDWRYILERGVLVNEDDDMDRTLLSYAAEDGYTDVVELLLNNGFDINTIDILKQTPLDWAIWKDRTETTKLLRERGAKLGKELE